MFSNKTLNHISKVQRLSSHTSLYAKIFSQHHIFIKAKLDSTKKNPTTIHAPHCYPMMPTLDSQFKVMITFSSLLLVDGC